jgi:hypothetical protein
MESSGTTPGAAVPASDLADLFAGPIEGQYATVYLTTDAAVENAAQRNETRWKGVRRALADAGAPDDVLGDIDPLIADAHHEGATLAVVANAARGIVTVDHLQSPPRGDAYRWAPLPWVGPIIEARQSAVPHIMVTADRKGADIVVVRPGRPDVEREAGGNVDPLAKSAPGGWSQRRYQQRAENSWEENAGEVASELTNLVERSGARLVTATGDVRALQFLREHLPDHIDALLELVEGDTSELAASTVRLVDTIVAADTRALIQKFKEERGQTDRAADGVAATVSALNSAQVDVLLVHDDPDDDRSLWFGDDPVTPIPIATSPTDLKDLGVDSPTEGRLVDVLVRAAAGTGASVRIVPKAGGPTESVGAVLRWS